MDEIVAVADHENVCEEALLADLGIEEVDLDDVTFDDTMLSAA
jgi:hypothetical protein